MAKGHFQFRPQDGSILTWMRQQAQKDKRSLNSWIEVHFERMKQREENPENIMDILHRLAHQPDKPITQSQKERWAPMLEAINMKMRDWNVDVNKLDDLGVLHKGAEL